MIKAEIVALESRLYVVVVLFCLFVCLFVCLNVAPHITCTTVAHLHRDEVLRTEAVTSPTLYKLSDASFDMGIVILQRLREPSSHLISCRGVHHLVPIPLQQPPTLLKLCLAS